MSDELTPKQEAFCREFLVDFNQTQAAKRAGYSAATAAQQASRLLSNVKVQSRITQLNERVKQRNDVDVDYVIRKLRATIEADVADYFIVTRDGYYPKGLEDLTPQQRLAISEVHTTAAGVVKLKLNDRLKALDMLARHLGFYHEELVVKFDRALDELSFEEVIQITTVQHLQMGLPAEESPKAKLIRKLAEKEKEKERGKE